MWDGAGANSRGGNERRDSARRTRQGADRTWCGAGQAAVGENGTWYRAKQRPGGNEKRRSSSGHQGTRESTPFVSSASRRACCKAISVAAHLPRRIVCADCLTASDQTLTPTRNRSDRLCVCCARLCVLRCVVWRPASDETLIGTRHLTRGLRSASQFRPASPRCSAERPRLSGRRSWRTTLSETSPPQRALCGGRRACALLIDS